MSTPCRAPYLVHYSLSARKGAECRIPVVVSPLPKTILSGDEPFRGPLSSPVIGLHQERHKGTCVGPSTSYSHRIGNQVFEWRRAFERGEVTKPSCSGARALLAVSASAQCEAVTREARLQPQPTTSGPTHIEFPGLASISMVCGADPILSSTEQAVEYVQRPEIPVLSV